LFLHRALPCGTWAVSTATGIPAYGMLATGSTGHPFRMALNAVSAAPDPALETTSSKHLTKITALSSSYLPSTPP